MRFRSVVLVALLALPVLIGCKKKVAPVDPEPTSASGALTSVPVTGANTVPTAPPVMQPDEPVAAAATDAGTTPGQRKRRSLKGQHAKE
jgi:hypothetical protein